MEGQVKWFDLRRKYGLIEILDEREEMVLGEFLFVQSACIGPVPWKHARVTFTLNDAPASANSGSPVAVDVRRVNQFEPRAPIRLSA